MLLYHARLAPKAAEIRSDLDADVLLIQVAEDSGTELLPDAVDYDTALAGSSTNPPATEPSSDDLHTVFTGGTTGLLQGCPVADR